MLRHVNRALSRHLRHASRQRSPFVLCSTSLSTSCQRVQVNRTLADQKAIPAMSVDVPTHVVKSGEPTADASTSQDTAKITKLQYLDPIDYHSVYTSLVALEERHHRELVNNLGQNVGKVTWEKLLVNKIIYRAIFPWPSYNDKMELMLGDKLILTPGGELEYVGRIVQMPSEYDDTCVVEFELGDVPSELRHLKGDRVKLSMDFIAKPNFDDTSFNRMREALVLFKGKKKNSKSRISREITETILGNLSDKKQEPSMAMDLDVPGLPGLNFSQSSAVRQALSAPFTLIQGPPGTGKTVTSATIVYKIHEKTRKKIMVCAPSNIAVDNLAEQIAKTGLKVVRISAKSRDLSDCTISSLELRNNIKGRLPYLDQLIEDKAKIGRLTRSDHDLMKKMSFDLEMKVIEDADVLCCTCITAADDRITKAMKKYTFGAILIDEAAQAVEPEVLVPIMLGTEKVILVGDHKQLGPTIFEDKAVNKGFDKSMFERLIEVGHEYTTLEEQYRMHPAISAFPRNAIYKGALQDGITANQRRWFDVDWRFPTPNVPLMFWQCNGQEGQFRDSHSYHNVLEAINVAKLVKRLLDAGVNPGQIGIITPYDAQRGMVVRNLEKRGIFTRIADESKIMDVGKIEIANVDAFQGREKDIIIISTVRSNSDGNLGFLTDERRLNVTLTRARYGLIIVGNAPTLSRSRIWRGFISMCRKKNCLVTGPLENLNPYRDDLMKARKESSNFTDEIIEDEVEDEQMSFGNNNVVDTDLSKEIIQQYDILRRELQEAEELWAMSDRDQDLKAIRREILDKHGKIMRDLKTKHGVSE